MSADIGAVRRLPAAVEKEIVRKRVVTMEDVILMTPSVASGLPGLQGRICSLFYEVSDEKE